MFVNYNLVFCVYYIALVCILIDVFDNSFLRRITPSYPFIEKEPECRILCHIMELQ